MSKRFSKIYVEITNKCNLNCSFCSVDNLPKKEMSIDEFKIVISKIKDYTDNIYLHLKGEPFLHHALEEILSICDNEKMKVSITTNGTLLDKRKDILLKHKIKQLNVSLHSENNIPNYFNNVFNTCDEIKKNTTIVYRVWTLSRNKIDKRIISALDNHYQLSDEVLKKIDTSKNIKISDNIYLDKDYKFDWPVISNNKSNIGTCLGTKTHIGILVNGDVVPCCLDSNGVIVLGNIYACDMKDILNSDMFIRINKGFQNNELVCDLCKSCTFRKRFDRHVKCKKG